MTIDTKSQPRASGAYGLFNLDRSPLSSAAAGALAMTLPAEPQSWAVSGIDTYAPHAVSRYDSADSCTLVVGEIECGKAMVQRLGLPGNASTAQIAAAALERFGKNTPAELIGEWTLINWKDNRKLTLMLSLARRDRLFYACQGAHIACAPNLFSLGKIQWVGNAVDEAGLLFPMGRAPIRSATGSRTMLRAVHQLEPGCSAIFSDSGRCEHQKAEPFAVAPRWQGSYNDAVDETESLLRTIIRDRQKRHEKSATLLSGGLDSSLLSWLAAEENPQDGGQCFLTSVAPPGSNIADEANFAAIVADHLGSKIQPVYPAQNANVYRPPDHILGGASGPILSTRHCLTEALQIAARTANATMMVNGTYGEMTVTARLPAKALHQSLRAVAATAYRQIWPRDEPAARDPFHIRLAPHRLKHLPEPIRSAIAGTGDNTHTGPPDGVFGYTPGIEKALALPNEFYPGAVRMDYPFRDVRLLRLFASMPMTTLLKGGHDRPIVRQILSGNLPDAIRLRRRGMPASPDQMARLQSQAADARNRISEFRRAEIDDWIDLDWLDEALSRVAVRGARSIGEANMVQLTAMAAEFLYWWRKRN